MRTYWAAMAGDDGQASGEQQPPPLRHRLCTILFVLVVLGLLAFTTRLWPMHISTLPFNNDGLTECRIASDILAWGSLEYPSTAFYFNTHSVVTPSFNVLLAYVSSAVGVPPLYISQMVVAVVSIVTILGTYLLAKQITGSAKGGIAAAVFIALLGTAAFVTGSAWKESLGYALMVLFFYAYANRSDIRFLVLEILLLLTIPLVHHLVTAVVYIALGYLTLWSLYFAAKTRAWRPRHLTELLVFVVTSTITYSYYSLNSLDKLGYVSGYQDVLKIAAVFLGFLLLAVVALGPKRYVKWTLAPIPGVAIVAFVLWDYVNPVFPYIPNATDFVIILMLCTGALVSAAWFGFEELLNSRLLLRAVPLGMLLPAVTLMTFALLSGFSIQSHQLVYRTFDFADLALAMGVGMTVAHLARKPRAEWLVVVTVMAALLLTFPFAYETSALLGERHDTQEYEVDAVEWLEYAAGSDSMLQSDERISYIAMAISGFGKMPYLPSRIMDSGFLGEGAFYMLETEWTTVGVSDYPDGYLVLNGTEVALIVSSSNVFYVGGPVSNQIVVFSCTEVGQEAIIGDY